MLLLLALAALTLAYALASRGGRRLGLTPPIVFTAVGLAAAHFADSIPHLEGDNGGVLSLSEATLVLVLFTGATEIDLSAFRKALRLPERLLGIGFPLTFLAGWGAALWLLPDLSMATAALVAIVLTPTDAALGRAVIIDERLPLRIRQTINAESGFNDGLAFPFFAFVLALAAGEAMLGSRATAAAGLGVQLAVGLLGLPLGALLGYGGGWLSAHARRRDWAEPAYLKLGLLTLPAIAYAAAELAEVNGFLAAFAAGLLFGPGFLRDGGPVNAAALPDADSEASLQRFAEVESELLTIVVFFAFGAVPLAASLEHLAWRHAAYAALSLTVVRMLPVALSLLGTGVGWRTTAFVGWFGPRGLGSIVYLLLAAESLLDAQRPNAAAPLSEVNAVVCATVFGSILLHGITSGFLPGWYGRAVERDN